MARCSWVEETKLNFKTLKIENSKSSKPQNTETLNQNSQNPKPLEISDKVPQHLKIKTLENA